jgi:5'(3')-deoxyribonucleotidase
MKIGLDFDGVIANSHPMKSVIAKQMFGVDIPPERFFKESVVENGLSLEQYKLVKENLYFNDHDILPIKDAPAYISLLLSRGHDIKIVTSRTGDTLKKAENLLKKYNIDLPLVGVGYGLSKAVAAEGLDLFVDDDIEKLIPLNGIVKHLLLFSSLYNQHNNEGFFRVDSWNDIYKYITEKV